MYLVVDTEWNRQNAPNLIGRTYEAGEAPSYTALHKIEDAPATCPLCKESEGHSLSCPTRWYS